MKTYTINGIEINKLLTTTDMTQGDRSVRHCFNSLLEALGTPVEEVKEEPKELTKELTIEERKAKLEEGWEEQENYKYTTDISTSRYLTKQKIIAKLNTVIDKLNKEEGWVEDWIGFQQDKYYFSYSVENKKIRSFYGGYYKELLLLNYMSKKTTDFLLENYKEELETLFEVK